MTEQPWDRVDPLAARWKKFTVSDDAERVAAVEHSPTSELQRYIKEVDEVRADIDGLVSGLEKKYGLFETGDIGADVPPDERDAHRHQALLALRQAYEEASAEMEDRELAGEV
ncbi:MAG: hypothetical protein M3Z37_01660 [Candidatus Eremiobacteraeota bacterium]|nr:hypothetical protein [Candidatus Eremiobacteraeota bacterium]